MQSMKKLKYLDILWTFKIDIKQFLLVVQYPVYGQNISELTMREQLRDSSFFEAFIYALNEWTVLKLKPRTLNIVTKAVESVIPAICQWMNTRSFISAQCYGNLKVYSNFNSLVSWVPIFPAFQFHLNGQRFLHPFVMSNDYGVSGLLGRDHIILTSHFISDSNIVYVGRMSRCHSVVQCTPFPLTHIGFITYFDASTYSFFYSSHLEQLANAFPHLQHLNLLGNINCLKSLQGLSAIATCCQKLEGLNILGISYEEVEDCIQLWRILVNLQLTYLAIELCCLLCYENNQTKQSVFSLHQKCVKMKALESCLGKNCAKCAGNTHPLLLSNFPLLIHGVFEGINMVSICERLRYLQYTCDDISLSWSSLNFNLEQLYIESDRLVLLDSDMNALSAHGRLVHVILNINFVTQDGIAALIHNSPHLITLLVNIRTAAVWRILFNPRDFKSQLEKIYSHRKLFLCGIYRLVKGKIPKHDLDDLIIQHNMAISTLWYSSPLPY